MANNHKVLITSGIAATNVDSLVLCGIAPSDMDNGTLVTLGNIGLRANGGFEYNVAAATAASTGCYIVATPIPGTNTDLALQVYNDPRYFYNQTGAPMSLRRLVPGDHIEVVGVTGLTVGQYATAVYGASASAPQSGTYFTVVAAHTVAIGQEVVPSFILRVERN